MLETMSPTGQTESEFFHITRICNVLYQQVGFKHGELLSCFQKKTTWLATNPVFR